MSVSMHDVLVGLREISLVSQFTEDDGAMDLGQRLCDIQEMADGLLKSAGWEAAKRRLGRVTRDLRTDELGLSEEEDYVILSAGTVVTIVGDGYDADTLEINFDATDNIQTDVPVDAVEELDAD